MSCCLLTDESGSVTPRGGRGLLQEKPKSQLRGNTKSPLQEKPKVGRATPPQDEVELFGSRKPTKPSSNMDDIFGRRKSPTDQNLFGSRKNSKDNLNGNDQKSMEFGGRQTPTTDAVARRTPNGELKSRESPKSQVLGRKSPKDVAKDKERSAQQTTMDDIFGAKKRVESPLFKSKQLSDTATRPVERQESFGHDRRESPKPAIKPGSYMSSLLADSDDEPQQGKRGHTTSGRSSYIDNLLGDEKKEQSSVSELVSSVSELVSSVSELLSSVSGLVSSESELMSSVSELVSSVSELVSSISELVSSDMEIRAYYSPLLNNSSWVT